MPGLIIYSLWHLLQVLSYDLLTDLIPKSDTRATSPDNIKSFFTD